MHFAIRHKLQSNRQIKENAKRSFIYIGTVIGCFLSFIWYHLKKWSENNRISLLSSRVKESYQRHPFPLLQLKMNSCHTSLRQYENIVDFTSPQLIQQRNKETNIDGGSWQMVPLQSCNGSAKCLKKAFLRHSLLDWIQGETILLNQRPKQMSIAKL